MKARYSCHLALFALLLLLNATQTVFANETPWQEVAPGAELRLISANKMSGDGYVHAAIQLRMEPGLKTYWRIPGETGIPMIANWEGSTNVKTAKMLWPMPTRSLAYEVMDYIYEGDLTIPLQVLLATDDRNAILNARLNLGICSDICVPVLWKGALQIDLEKPSTGHAFRIQAAYAKVPIEDDRADAPFEKMGYDVALDQFITLPAADPLTNETLILDLPKSLLLFDLPHSDPESGLLTVESLADFDLSTLVGQQIRLTYDSAVGPFTKLVKIEALSRVDLLSENK